MLIHTDTVILRWSSNVHLTVHIYDVPPVDIKPCHLMQTSQSAQKVVICKDQCCHFVQVPKGSDQLQ